MLFYDKKLLIFHNKALVSDKIYNFAPQLHIKQKQH